MEQAALAVASSERAEARSENALAASSQAVEAAEAAASIATEASANAAAAAASASQVALETAQLAHSTSVAPAEQQPEVARASSEPEDAPERESVTQERSLETRISCIEAELLMLRKVEVPEDDKQELGTPQHRSESVVASPCSNSFESRPHSPSTVAAISPSAGILSISAAAALLNETRGADDIREIAGLIVEDQGPASDADQASDAVGTLVLPGTPEPKASEEVGELPSQPPMQTLSVRDPLASTDPSLPGQTQGAL
eukprot:5618477-Amphidinium_carterae.1